jgi:hypothetical protein
MKKVLITIILLSCISTFSYSQSKTEFGITTEGSWFTPRTFNKYSESNRNGWGTGIGVYASRSIFWRISADIGLAFRYKQMQQHYTMPYTGASGYGGTENGSVTKEEGWKKYDLDYLVIPIHLQLLTGKYFFIRSGIEASWLTNFDSGNKKSEYNWTAGFGSQKYKLKWSVNFIRGFKEVGFLNGLYEIENGKYRSATVYRNQMLQLSLSYPIWQLK